MKKAQIKSYCSPIDLDQSGPLVVDSAACPNGQEDAVDLYTCAGGAASYSGSDSFGEFHTASLFLVIGEDDGSATATTSLNNGAGGNPVTLLDGGIPPVLDATWPLTDAEHFPGRTLSQAVWFTGSLPPGAVLLTNGAGSWEVIGDPSTTFGLSRTAAFVGGSADHSLQVPLDTRLLGAAFTVQAIQLGGGTPYSLTNGLDVVVGF